MKLIVLLLFVSMLTVSAKNYAQSGKFNFEAENKEVSFVLKKIEENSDYRFFYVREQIDVKRKVSIEASKYSVENILDELFEDHGVEYEIKDNNLIVLVPGNTNDPTQTKADQNSISGQVKGKDGVPLYAVTVVVQGTVNGTVTDFDGKFTIPNVTSEDVLLFSMIGMVTKEVKVENQSIINITMEENVVGLDEVVIIGYGSVRKADLTGAVSTVDSEDLVKIATSSTAETLQGRMTGVQVTRTSGEPGSGSTIKIRGIGSLKSDNSPLIMIDGYQGSINDVSPNDIESVSVLKDASAASIYGARAANGVILITTKRGKEGKTTVDIVVEHGISELTKQPAFLNAGEFAQKANEANAWDGREAIWIGDRAPEKLGVGTNWFDYVYKQGKLDKYHVSIRGGSKKSKYALSAQYLDEEGLIDGTGYSKIQTRFNFDHEFNKVLSIGANYSLSRSESYNNNENIWGDGIGYNGYGLAIAATRSAPSIPAYFEDGSKGIYLLENPGERPGNGTLPPTWYYGNKEKINQGMTNRVSFFAEINILKGLKFKSVVNGYQGSSYDTHWHGTWEALYPGTDIAAQSNTRNGLNTNSSSGFGWEVQELLTYDKTFGKHGITALAGFSAEQFQRQKMDHNVQGFLSNELHVADAGSEIMGIGGTKYINSLESLFGRINYDYDNKYLLQVTVRRDGSSVFAPGYQYGTFPSISGAWKISSESFMEDISWLTNLKVRGGYGQLGNASIPSFKWLSSLNLTDGHPFGSGFPQSFQPAYYVTEIPNYEVQWETTTSLDIGIDVGMFNNRLTLEYDYYDKSTTDLLWPATVPETAGFLNGPMVNIGEVTNNGWELTVGWDDKIGDITYGVSANISKNDNMVVDMGGIPEQLDGNIMVKEGYPINSYWGYKLHENKLWKTWDELENNVHRAGDIRPGDFRYMNLAGADENGDKTDIPDDVINSYDMVYLGDGIPDLYYGFSGYIEYKGFDFNFLLNGEKGKEAMVGATYGGGYSGGNVLQYYYNNRAILDENGEVVSGFINATGADAGGGSEAIIHDISFLRVKNLQLGYSLPSDLTKRVGITNLRIYVNATNPFLFTNYVGWDQESQDLTRGKVSGGGNQYVPVSKIYTVGLSIKL